MKKLLLTVCTAALFSIAAIAQEQEKDTIPTESNQFRTTEQPEPDSVVIDSASTDFQQGVNEVERDAEQTGEKIQQETEPSVDEVERPADEPGEVTEQDPQRTDNDMNKESDESIGQQGTAAPDVEVIESKEGPDNQVVYKYQGELFYVDRVEKKLVKAEESKLQDSPHKVIIKDSNNEPKDSKDNP